MVKRMLRRLILWALADISLPATEQPQAPARQIMNEWLYGQAPILQTEE